MVARSGGGEVSAVVYCSTGAVLRFLRSVARSMLCENPTPWELLSVIGELRPRPDARNFGGVWGKATGTATAATSAAAPIIRAIEAFSWTPRGSRLCGTGVSAIVTVVPHR